MNNMQYIDIIDAVVGAILGAIFALASTYFFYFKNQQRERHGEFKISIANLMGLLYEAKEHWFLIVEYSYLKQIQIMDTPKYRMSHLVLRDEDFESYRLRMISLHSEILKSLEVLKSYQLKFGTRMKKLVVALNLGGNKIPDHYILPKTLGKISPEAVSLLLDKQFNDRNEIGGQFDRVLESLKSKLSEDEIKFNKISNS